MDFSVTSGYSDSLSGLARARNAKSHALSRNDGAENADNANLPAVLPSRVSSTFGTRLVNEQRQELDGAGYRLSRTFENSDGRTFSKLEEFILTQSGARKTVIQQNPSGSIVRYEEVLDREQGGNFRRTQRFQDGSGDVETAITADYRVTDAFILTSGQGSPSYAAYTPFSPLRGTQLDLRA